MNQTSSEEPLRPSFVTIAHSSFIDVAQGDSHTYYGNVYNEISSHAGNQLRHITFGPSSGAIAGLSLAIDLGPCFYGRRLQFPGT